MLEEGVFFNKEVGYRSFLGLLYIIDLVLL